MQNESEELQRAAVNALRNIVYENNENKMEVKDCEGLPVILTLLKKNRDIETRQQLTGKYFRFAPYIFHYAAITLADPAKTPAMSPTTKTSRSSINLADFILSPGLLWNLSSHDLLKEQLTREAVKPLTDSVLVPCSGISEGEDPKLELLADSETFYNATGCLR